MNSPEIHTATTDAARLNKGLGAVAATLLGVGVLFAVAANWQHLPRFAQLALLMGVVLAALAAAHRRPTRFRNPALLVAGMATGGVLAWVGVTYQTGADPWQLFAVWAVLVLPWVWAARSDWAWLLWVVLGAVALVLWGGVWFMHPWTLLWGFGPRLLGDALVLAASGGLLVAVVQSAKRQGVAAPRAAQLACMAALLSASSYAIWALVRHDGLALVGWLAGALTVLALGGWAWQRHAERFASLVLACLCGLTLAWGALIRLLVLARGDWVSISMFLVLLGGGSLAWLLRWLHSLHVQHSPPPAAGAPVRASRMLAVLGFLGAWVAVLPLMVFMGLVFQDSIFKPLGASIVAALALAAGLSLLRNEHADAAKANWGLVGVLVGLVFATLAIWRIADHGGELPLRYCIWLVWALLAAVLALTRVGWVQWGLAVLWGCVGLALHWQAAEPSSRHLFLWVNERLLWPNMPLMAAGWLALVVLGPRAATDRPMWGRLLPQVVGGLATALWLAALWSSGSALGPLIGVGRALGSAESAEAGAASWMLLDTRSALGALVVLACGAWLAWRWWQQGVGRAQLALLAWPVLLALIANFFVRDCGVAVLLLTVAVAQRWRGLVLAAIVLLVAQLSGFYYALGWPLLHKAALLMGLGAVMAAALWAYAQANRVPSAGVSTPVEHSASNPRWLLAGLALLVLGVGVDVWRKEQVLRNGQPVFLSLRPADPRSLLQGDYMALRFDFGGANEALFRSGNINALSGPPSQVLAKLDAQGVAQVLRVLEPKESVPAQHVALPLKWKKGDPTLVTDAFFFPEGQGDRLGGARFGEFRALADGRVLLVGLTDDQRQPLYGHLMQRQ